MSKVSVILGSERDMHVAERVVNVLEREQISYELRVISAHRQPEELDRYLRERSDEISVFIAIAGLSAALPGVIASKTNKVVIGVPVSGPLLGLDALLSMVQMPSGVPVAVVGIDNGENAAILAAKILKLKEEKK
ncbi:MAG: 5-(carboxyamino)imidazole ribonucleotide mutase [Canidatus Methanoxibalbensis ujae]|nr:5-(carboxyamino)imidazole ribonucleotide mutase [Candidatus Methanoxibalbensis ujae]MCW7079046.1 5-(carboxyamino)imidazole ribonucleotide mutase [Candidatus Methanoxibalbensis ujae]